MLKINLDYNGNKGFRLLSIYERLNKGEILSKEDLANNFTTKYHELIYQKFMNNELQKEEMQL